MKIPYMPMLDDITPSAMQLVSTIQNHSSEPISVDALLLHPSSSNNWQPVWITRSVNNLPATLTNSYQKEYEQNRYEFNGFTIEKLFISDHITFMVIFGDWTLFSESSIALESIIRSLTGSGQKMQLTPEQYEPGTIIMNTENMDLWVQQLSRITDRPLLSDMFRGASPVSFRNSNSETEEWEWQLRGNMQVQEGATDLVTYLTQPPSDFSLDRFIPVNIAGFSIFQTDQQTLMNSDDFEARHEIDLHIQDSPRSWHSIQQSLRSETAFISFAESGPSSSSEYLFLRSIRDAEAVRDALDELTEDELVIQDENTYFINSTLLGKLMGSNLFPIDDFYVTVYDNVLALAQRKGLAESVGGDASRRRVMFYDDGYTSIRNSLPDSLSSIHYIDASRFGTYIQPWLFPQNYINSLVSNLDHFVITTRFEPGSNSADISMSSFQRETENYPFTEQWIFPIEEEEITGPPVLENLTGSGRNEVIFSTENGSVYALASDGTVILQASTMEDEPVGPPVVYDWYGNDQNIIMQAAGNKIYAWNQSGTILPNFPVSLAENATTPLTVTDITGNGVAEMIVATADRNVHILNARGQAISGWPQATNSVVKYKPLIAEIDNQQSLFVFAENALHGWNANGRRKNNYPVFLPSQMQGSPNQYRNHILGAGLDGNLYSIGATRLFSDNLATVTSSEPLVIQSLDVSNSSLNVSPSHQEVLYSAESGFDRESLILLQTNNGSLFLYDENGELRFAESLGQPSSSDFPPFVTDINGDQRDDVVALANFGRLYAWDILSAERHEELPTTAMSYPVISDFLGNGNQEIIARTSEGLQCWTIHFTERE